jgi:hypothetical protein
MCAMKTRDVTAQRSTNQTRRLFSSLSFQQSALEIYIMNRFRSSFVLLAALLVVPFVAHADQQDLFSGTDGTNTYSFILPASPTPDFVIGDAFEIEDVAFTFDGTTTPGMDVTFFPTSGAGGLNLANPANGSVLLPLDFGPQLFTDPASAPTFILGSYTFDASPYDLTISAIPPSGTPEPSGLLLLGSGLIGIFGVARRKFTRG